MSPCKNLSAFSQSTFIQGTDLLLNDSDKGSSGDGFVSVLPFFVMTVHTAVPAHMGVSASVRVYILSALSIGKAITLSSLTNRRESFTYSRPVVVSFRLVREALVRLSRRGAVVGMLGASVFLRSRQIKKPSPFTL